MEINLEEYTVTTRIHKEGEKYEMTLNISHPTLELSGGRPFKVEKVLVFDHFPYAMVDITKNTIQGALNG